MRDPKAALESSDLNATDRATVLSGDQGRIYSALKDLPLPPAAPPSPAPQLPTVVAAQYPYGVPAQGATLQGVAPQGAVPPGQYYGQAAAWPAGYPQPAVGAYGMPTMYYYVPGWPIGGPYL
jgi:hypothetical protein